MNMYTIFSIVRKDLATGPRVVLLFWVVAMPLLITLLIRLIFGGLVDRPPRLGIVDQGRSSISLEAAGIDEIDVVFPGSVSDLKKQVESHDLDAGLVLQEGFDEAVKAGDAPQLEFYIAGESLASDRITLAVTALDLVRAVAGQPAPVSVEMKTVGDGAAVPLVDRLVPMLVLLAVTLSSIFLPAASLIQERETKTLSAVLVTPARVGEFMLAKGFVAFVLSLSSGVFTAALNLGFGEQFSTTLLIILGASFLCVPIGLALGAAVKDMSTMCAIWKTGALVLFAPAILMLFPSVPRWIAMIFPTYYFIGPLYDVNVEAVGIVEVLH